jgi:hypothetical protein
MYNQTIYKNLTKIISKNIFINLCFSLFLLLNSCESYKGEIHKPLPSLASEQHIKAAVIETVKKSDDPRTWPKINKLAVIENYALVRYAYQANFPSEMLLVKKANGWRNIFGGDTISVNTMKKLKIPPKIAKKLLDKFKN